MSIGKALVTVAILALCAWLYGSGRVPWWLALSIGINLRFLLVD